MTNGEEDQGSNGDGRFERPSTVECKKGRKWDDLHAKYLKGDRWLHSSHDQDQTQGMAECREKAKLNLARRAKKTDISMVDLQSRL